jgi:hypothetical protein
VARARSHPWHGERPLIATAQQLLINAKFESFWGKLKNKAVCLKHLAVKAATHAGVYERKHASYSRSGAARLESVGVASRMRAVRSWHAAMSLFPSWLKDSAYTVFSPLASVANSRPL